MTPAQPKEHPQPKEYIITEEELDHFVTCSSKNDCVDCKYSAPEFQCTPRIMANKIRSRPHTAPAENRPPFCKVWDCAREENCRAIWIEEVEAARAEAARQAREDVLDAIEEWRCTQDLTKGVLAFEIALGKKIESLRHHSEQQEQPR